MEANNEVNIRWIFGRAIRKRRRELDLSQEELAEKAELHRTYISSIESGKCNISLDNIEKLAKSLNISISDLFAACNNTGEN
ncbi:helix-turn-helix transcriptional regulator [Aphanizomenon sp. CS-733/32]|uniref:helix-turn-helix domain-containing protein n=1 Tax=Aphanizomenon sp. CS-733/32 TaxID=3021715 RepID=UPI002330CE55|nr:helix-turn-helix transcriptional regulator [Aphanizomenon sp. CS-733/32]MDB9311207.1 helix-turn-helix transcriptional regulator [Aphanizomenon sp. CS-733/32]